MKQQGPGSRTLVPTRAFALERVTGIDSVSLLDGISPTIGWEFRPPAKGGSAFVIVGRTRLGSLKVVDSFPLTEDGWARAWQSLVGQNPAAVPQILAGPGPGRPTRRG